MGASCNSVLICAPTIVLVWNWDVNILHLTEMNTQTVRAGKQVSQTTHDGPFAQMSTQAWHKTSVVVPRASDVDYLWSPRPFPLLHRMGCLLLAYCCSWSTVTSLSRQRVLAISQFCVSSRRCQLVVMTKIGDNETHSGSQKRTLVPRDLSSWSVRPF